MIFLPPNENQQSPAVDFSLPDDPEFMSEQDKQHIKVIKTPLCSRCYSPLKYDVRFLLLLFCLQL